MTPDVKGKIRLFLSKHVRNLNFADDEDFFASGNVNSLVAMELVLFVEKEFVIQVTNDELNLANFSSVERLEKYVRSKTGG